MTCWEYCRERLEEYCKEKGYTLPKLLPGYSKKDMARRRSELEMILMEFISSDG